MLNRVNSLIFILIASIFWSCSGQNHPPMLAGASAPDSLAKGDTLSYYIFISAFDPEGPDDIDSVYFVVTRPDGTPNPTHFGMHDDGMGGDSVAGDNRYTQGIQAPAPQNQSGDYIFTFNAFDKDNNKSNNPHVIITAF